MSNPTPGALSQAAYDAVVAGSPDAAELTARATAAYDSNRAELDAAMREAEIDR